MALAEGTTIRLFATARTEQDVAFNLFMIDTPEQNGELVERCANGVMSVKHFAIFLKALQAIDVSTNIEVHDRFVKRR